MADTIAFVCAVLGLAGACIGAWILIVMRGRLSASESDQVISLVLVGLLLLTIGYILSRPAG